MGHFCGGSHFPLSFLLGSAWYLFVEYLLFSFVELLFRPFPALLVSLLSTFFWSSFRSRFAFVVSLFRFPLLYIMGSRHANVPADYYLDEDDWDANLAFTRLSYAVLVPYCPHDCSHVHRFLSVPPHSSSTFIRFHTSKQCRMYHLRLYLLLAEYHRIQSIPCDSDSSARERSIGAHNLLHELRAFAARYAHPLVPGLLRNAWHGCQAIVCESKEEFSTCVSSDSTLPFPVAAADAVVVAPTLLPSQGLSLVGLPFTLDSPLGSNSEFS